MNSIFIFEKEISWGVGGLKVKVSSIKTRQRQRNDNTTEKQYMSYETELDLIKVLGWTKSTKFIYILKQLKNGKTEDEIFESLSGLMKPKSFNNYLHQINRIGDDIKFV